MATGITSHELRKIYTSGIKRNAKHKLDQTIFLSALSVIATVLFRAIDSENEKNEQ